MENRNLQEAYIERINALLPAVDFGNVPTEVAGMLEYCNSDQQEEKQCLDRPDGAIEMR